MARALNYRRLMFLLQLLFIVSSSLILSCNGVSEPKFGSVKGRIVFTAPKDVAFSGGHKETAIQIGLYQFATRDTVLTRIKTEHPSIGAMIPPKALFDHRDNDPIRTATADDNGLFEINEVSPGTYILVVIASGYSLKYLYDVSVNANNASDMGEILLSPLVMMGGYYPEQVVFSEGITYWLNENTVVDNHVEIENSALILLSPGVSLRFTSNVDFPESSSDPFRVDSSVGAFDMSQRILAEVDYGSTLSFSGPDLNIKNGVLRHLNNSLGLIEIDLHASHLFIQSSSNGISISSGGAVIQNCTFSLIPGVSFNCTADGLPITVTESIFTGGQKAVNPNTSGLINISDSYFNGFGTAVEMILNEGIISYSAFNDNDYDIKSGYSNLQVTYNDFFHSRIETLWMRSIPVVATNNNFYATDGYFTNIRGPYPSYSHVNQNVIATGSYWHPANYAEYIFDSGDNDQYPGQNCLYRVLVEPRQPRPVSAAGIRD